MEGKIITGAAEVIVSLERRGVETVFGIPGIHNLDVYDALLSSKLRHITSRNESGAGFMALGAARTSGKPGVALVITGPGLTNILTPMGEAYHDCVPMLVISSQIPNSQVNTHSRSLHELEKSTNMTSSVCKAAWCVEYPEDIEAYIAGAYALASQGRPGPVHLEIPLDVLRAEKEGQSPRAGSDVFQHSVSLSPEEGQMKRAVKSIAESTRIAMVCGGGAVAAAEEVRGLQKLTGAVVVTTTAGKGVFPEDSQLSLGARLHFPGTKDFLESMDLIIAVGTQLSSTDLWDNELDIDPKLILINAENGVLQRFPNALLRMHADTAETLRQMLTRLEEKAWSKEKPESVEAGLAAEVKSLLTRCTSEVGLVTGLSAQELHPMLRMLKEIRTVLPEEGVFVTDMTSPAYAALSEWSVNAPASFLHPVGFGALGYALPSAIGIQATQPRRPVCVLAGDGGFQFTLQELAVAVALRQGLPIVIWNNRGYGEIRRTEEARHPGKRIAVDIVPPRFEQIAKAYGTDYARFESGTIDDTAESFRTVLRNAWNNTVPTLIEIMETNPTGGAAE
jgi:5-guanidino-2-oxopentanoate decarboxylase